MRVTCEQLALLKVHGWCLSLHFNLSVGAALSKAGFFWGSYADADSHELSVSGFY